MGDDRGHARSGGGPSRSTVLTPPHGLPMGYVPAVPTPTVPDDARTFDTRSAPRVGPARDVMAPPAGPVAAPCLCGHDHDTHRHWRPGTDCGVCGQGSCTGYRARDGIVRRLLRGVGLIG